MKTTKIMLLAINLIVISVVIAHYLQRTRADPNGDFPFFLGSIHFGILVVFLAGEGIALIRFFGYAEKIIAIGLRVKRAFGWIGF